jgi:hypothetical protein
MAQGTLTTDAWREREALREDLAAARCQFAGATDCLRRALNPKERARDFVRKRPVAAAVGAIAAAFMVTRLVPALVWRSKGSLLSRFIGHLVKGAASAALPIITAQFSSRLKTRRPPNTFVLERHDPVVP